MSALGWLLVTLTVLGLLVVFAAMLFFREPIVDPVERLFEDER